MPWKDVPIRQSRAATCSVNSLSACSFVFGSQFVSQILPVIVFCMKPGSVMYCIRSIIFTYIHTQMTDNIYGTPLHIHTKHRAQ